MQFPPTLHPPPTANCRPTRLAESSVAAIDECSCGMLQLHLGAFTLRLAPCAAVELLSTLSDALAKRGAEASRGELEFQGSAATRRGQA